VHGADYFRRWHRDKANSGGLLVHKASHHFDLVNWWLGDVPATVYARGALRFYGADAARSRGLPPRPPRSAGSPGLATDPWALDMAAEPVLRRLYLEAEEADGYIRDQDVFGDGITAEDTMAAVVTYRSGAFLTYSLNAHSPWEGYRASVNGTAGRAELEVVERGQVRSVADGGIMGRPAVDPMTAGHRDAASPDDPRPISERLIVQRHWEPARVVPIPAAAGTHAGGDAPLLDAVFRAGHLPPDPLGRRAGYTDGLASAAVGIAANESIATGAPVAIADLGTGIG
jgi:predicted dehydrogenase